MGMADPVAAQQAFAAYIAPARHGSSFRVHLQPKKESTVYLLGRRHVKIDERFEGIDKDEIDG